MIWSAYNVCDIFFFVGLFASNSFHWSLRRVTRTLVLPRGGRERLYSDQLNESGAWLSPEAPTKSNFAYGSQYDATK